MERGDDAITPTLLQAEQTLWTAVGILATSPDFPEERVRSAWPRVQQVVPSDLPDRLVPSYQALHAQFQQQLAPAGGPSGLPLSSVCVLLGCLLTLLWAVLALNGHPWFRVGP